jgi:hypothetical protein
LQHAALGGGPPQCQPLLAVGKVDRTVTRHPHRHFDIGCALHADDLAFGSRLLYLAAEKVAAGAVVQLLQVEVLDVEV